MVAENRDVLVGIEFLIRPGGHVTHGHEGAGLDMRGGELPGFADVNEASFIFAEKSGCFGRGNFEFEHESSLSRTKGWHRLAEDHLEKLVW